MTGAIAQISRTEIGGVPVLHAPQPQGSPFLAQLVFRVGISDETLPFRGITHLVEHLALPVSHKPPVEFNGVVMGAFTHFWFSGPRDPVLGLLEETCATLADPPVGRLDRELALLSTEAETYSPGAFGTALALRFGASGHGLPGFREVGLPRIGQEDVRAWARERFNLGTVTLAFSGELPMHLDLSLPDGERLDPRTPEPVRDLKTPSVFAYGHDGAVWATMTCERSSAASLALWALRRRLVERLRGRRSLSYDVAVERDPLTDKQRHVFIYADCLPENQDAVAATIVATLDELAATGPTPLELEESAAQHERDDANDAFLSGALYWHASEAALGKPFESSAELAAAWRAVTSADAAATLGAALPTLLLGIAPSATVPGGRFSRYPVDSIRRVEGRRYRRRGMPLLTQKANERELVIGEEGVTLTGKDEALDEEYVRTVLFEETAAAVYFEEGSMRLYGLDGQEVYIDPEIWRRSGGMTEAVRRAIRHEVVVDLREQRSIFTDEDLAAGEHAFDKEDWPRAIELLSRGLEREPENEQAWVLLCIAELSLENRTAGVQAARKAVELAPNDFAPRRLLAHSLMETGHGDEAIEHARKLLELDPGDLLTLETAVFLLVEGSFEREALAIADRAVELFPNSFESHFARGWAAQALGELTEGRTSLERAISIRPSEMAENNLGWVLMQMGEPELALAKFDRALDLDADNLYARANRALALRMLGREDEGEREWRSWGESQLAQHQRALERDPSDADALWRSTRMLWDLGRDHEALSVARDAAERLPESPILQRSLTHVELVTGNVTQAAEAAGRALALDSGTFDSLDFAAWYGAFSGRERERASTAAREAAERRPDSTRAFAASGYGAVAGANYADAVASFDKALEREPLLCCHHAGRALAHLEDGNRAAAERDVQQALFLSHDRCRDALTVQARLAEKAANPA